MLYKMRWLRRVFLLFGFGSMWRNTSIDQDIWNSYNNEVTELFWLKSKDFSCIFTNWNISLEKLWVKEILDLLVEHLKQERTKEQTTLQLISILSNKKELVREYNQTIEEGSEIYSRLISHNFINQFSILARFFSLKDESKEHEQLLQNLQWYIKNKANTIAELLSKNNLHDISYFSLSNLFYKLKDEFIDRYKKSIEIKSISTNWDIKVLGSPSFIEEWIIRNLLSNAWKFANNKIIIQFYENEQNTIIEIIDDGDWISQKVLPHIFKENYTENIWWKNPEGSWKWLFYVNNILDKMWWEIKVETKTKETDLENHWTTFTIILPLIVSKETSSHST